MKQLLVATTNMGKLKEFGQLLHGRVESLLSLRDFPDLILPPETGTTFQENALIKSRHAAKVSGIPSIADDSGLEVDYLRGSPGVQSARYAGEFANDSENNIKLLKELSNTCKENRTARFVCCIAFCQPDGDCKTFSGELRGSIISEPKGINGFGYDPLFLVEPYNMTLAELDIKIKNSISHRSEALNKLIKYLSSETDIFNQEK